MKLKTKIKNLKTLLSSNVNFKINSPDGFVRVKEFVTKGDYIEHIVRSNKKTLRCNEGHLFETPNGWVAAKNIHQKLILADDGNYYPATLEKTDNIIPIVDLVIGHENHRYYANGLSSHNTNAGKTLTKCHLAADFLMKGYNVVYITMEMAEERISERIDANLMNIEINDIGGLPKETYKKKIDSIHSKTTGRLFVKEFPTAGAHVGHFRHLLRELELKKKFKADVVFIDYLNICASSRGSGSDNSYTLVKNIAEELRGLAVEKNLAIITSTQLTRQGFGASDIGMTDISESFGTGATADMVVGIIVTDDLIAQGQIMLKQIKNRFSDVTQNVKTILGMNRPKMKLFELEDNGSVVINKGIESKELPDTAPWESKPPKNSDPFAGFQI